MYRSIIDFPKFLYGGISEGYLAIYIWLTLINWFEIPRKKNLLTVLPSHYKVQIFWEGHTNLKKHSSKCWRYQVMLERNGSFFNFFGLLPIFELYHYNTICLKPEPFLFSDRVFFTASISKSSISCLGWHFFALGRRKIIVIVKERRIKESDRVRNLNLGWPKIIFQLTLPSFLA